MSNMEKMPKKSSQFSGSNKGDYMGNKLVQELRELNEKMQNFAERYQISDINLVGYPFERDFMEIADYFNQWTGAQNE